MALNLTQPVTSIQLIMNIMQSYAEVRMANGRLWHMTLDFYGLTHSRLPLMDIFMSLLTSYTARRDSIKKDETFAASRILCLASGLTHSLFCCGNQTPEDIVVITAIIAATLASTLVLLFSTTLQVAGLIYTSTGERKVPIDTSGDKATTST